MGLPAVFHSEILYKDVCASAAIKGLVKMNVQLFFILMMLSSNLWGGNALTAFGIKIMSQVYTMILPRLWTFHVDNRFQFFNGRHVKSFSG